ncbi:unnamed protein product [Oncorhynchus mykiss]|uniref:Transposase Tc1-like domain-containing protein n=1 Tax=Oncorhynchus mykiss TaxID=8022 RepID=A0A060WEN3_ONCMY|nr:unnamed protein product [Oncorhynchus mykiss]
MHTFPQCMGEGNNSPLLLRHEGQSIWKISTTLKVSSTTDTSEHQLFRGDCESGLHGQIAAKKPLLKDTNKKRLAWAKKHEQWTLDRWKSVLCPNLRFLVPTTVSL